MKISDFVSEYANPINTRKTAGLVDPQPHQTEQDGPKLVGDSPDGVNKTEQPIMVPPLQQKLELMKKDQGITNVFDDGVENKDPINVLKKMAGIPKTVIQTIGDENEN